jgi:hypothetical protein
MNGSHMDNTHCGQHIDCDQSIEKNGDYNYTIDLHKHNYCSQTRDSNPFWAVAKTAT